MTRTFVCVKCDSAEMDAAEIKAHLAEAHQCDGKGEKRMKMHIDHNKGYTTTYEWTFPGDVVVMEYVTGKREGEWMG